MHDFPGPITDDPSQQQVGLGRRAGPANPFIEFKQEEIERAIPARFERQVRCYPERLAVKTQSHEFTYEALNKAANRVAQTILEYRGEGQEPVALLFAKGAPLIVAILGVLKAGKIFMPTEPTLPPARITFMLEDAQAGLIVTDNHHLAMAQALAQHGCEWLNIDELDCSLSTEGPKPSLSPDASAYIFYTSGSTGQPKGVVTSHRHVLHDTMVQTNAFRICADDQYRLQKCGH